MREPAPEDEVHSIVHGILTELIDSTIAHCEEREKFVSELEVDYRGDVCLICDNVNLSALEDVTCVDRSGIALSQDNETNTNCDNPVHVIAPGENKKPVGILRDGFVEEKSFPKLFPTGLVLMQSV